MDTPGSAQAHLGMMKKVIAFLKKALFWLTLSGGMVFLWVASAYFLSEVLKERPHPRAVPPSLSDLATVFFGASSLALIIFSLLLAGAAIIEWQSVKENIKQATDAANRAADAASGRIGGLEKEIRGRVDSLMGLMIGTVHSDPLALEQKEEKKDYIAEAVYFCQKGYDRLQDVDGYGKLMALNNLLFYSCLLGREAKRDLFLEQSLQLRDIGHKFNAAAYLLTYCRVLLTYSDNLAALKEALAIAMEEIPLDTKPSPLQKLEAELYVRSLREKIEKLEKSSGIEGSTGTSGQNPSRDTAPATKA